MVVVSQPCFGTFSTRSLGSIISLVPPSKVNLRYLINYIYSIQKKTGLGACISPLTEEPQVKRCLSIVYNLSGWALSNNTLSDKWIVRPTHICDQLLLLMSGYWMAAWTPKSLEFSRQKIFLKPFVIIGLSHLSSNNPSVVQYSNRRRRRRRSTTRTIMYSNHCRPRAK